jgi:uncharacterized protein YndB with AHSA1/START domain
MRSDTQTITIEAPAGEVFRFVAEPENLPPWAVGFAREIRPDGDGWRVRTGGGAEVRVRFRIDAEQGVVDFWMVPAPGVEAVAYSRVVPNGDGADLVFTQQQIAGTADEVFEAQVAALGHELTVLKALLEVACPA